MKTHVKFGLFFETNFLIEFLDDNYHWERNL